MSPAKVVDRKPTAIALEIGTHRWCSCDRSDRQALALPSGGKAFSP